VTDPRAALLALLRSPDLSVRAQGRELLAALKDDEPALLRGADLSHVDLVGADLSGMDLRGTNLWLAHLRGADLSGANLRWSRLAGPLRLPSLRDVDDGSFIAMMLFGIGVPMLLFYEKPLLARITTALGLLAVFLALLAVFWLLLAAPRLRDAVRWRSRQLNRLRASVRSDHRTRWPWLG